MYAPGKLGSLTGLVPARFLRPDRGGGLAWRATDIRSLAKRRKGRFAAQGAVPGAHAQSLA